MKKKDPLLREIEEWTGHRSAAVAEQWWVGFIALFLLAIGVISLLLGCSAKGAECTLSWDASPVEESVTAYRVYVGLDLIATTANTTVTVNLPDRPCTVTVHAVNLVGQSPPASITLSYLTDQQSVDLRAWATLRAYYREHLPGPRFYRTRIERSP